jgi:hypothetical protein
MMDIEKITKASVISRAAIVDTSKPQKRFDNLLKESLQNGQCTYESLSAIGAD